MTREIKSADWPALCQRITQQRPGAMVKLEVIAPDGVKSEAASGATFQGLEFDNSDSCNDTITLRVRDHREIVHQMIDPIHIRLHASETTGDFNPLQIEAESGVTIITLHPAIHAQMLDGLAY